jgi:rhodanese-related sulfurtransferase
VSASPPSEDVSVRELARKRNAGEDFVLLDVREDEELALAKLDGALHVPMREIPTRLAEIPRDREVVVMCHGGVRSDSVAHYLRAQGYARVYNLSGGIDAWSCEVDPAVPRY